MACRPYFVLNEASFLGIGGVRQSVNKLFSNKGERNLFGPVKRFYVHGKLERAVGYDIASFVAGDFLDVPEQDAVLVSYNMECIDATIVMVTSDKGNKYAFLVSPEPAEITSAKKALLNGEWLKNGVER